jgi:glutaminyl-peptide cyclotransferase
LDRKVARTLLAAVWLGATPGCDGSDPAPPPVAASAGFDGERAFRDLVEQVRLGPRHPGSPGSTAVRELIRARLRQAGWVARDHVFEAELPDGTRASMVNLIGELPAPDPGVVMLVTHYDTKRLLQVPEFAGANDGASGVAVLLELARALARRPRALSYQLVFFDGEEAVGPHIRARDGLYGSRALAAKLQGEGELARLRALVLVDMVGDSDLNLSWGADSAPELVAPWVELAQRRGVALEGPMALVDDHTPFVEAGVPRVLSLIDFHYGERISPGWRWHGRGDALEAVSAASLNSFGNLLVEWLARVEPQLAGLEGANASR